MGWLSNLFGLIGNIGKVAKGAGDTALGYANLAYQKGKDAHLTGAQREANQFSAQQAEIARDWQEKMYNQYESPQARIRQYEEAGLNPALMYGDATGGNMPSASAPSSVSPPGGDINGAIAQLIGVKKSIAEIDNIRSLTNLNNEKAKTEVVGRDKVVSEIGLLVKQTESEHERAQLIAVQAVVEGKRGDLYDSEKELNSAKKTNEVEQGKIIKSNADYLLEHGFTRDQAATIIGATIIGGPQWLNLVGGTLGNIFGKAFGKAGPKTTVKQTRTNKDGKVTFEEVKQTVFEFMGEQ